MRSKTTKQFRDLLARQSPHVQAQARGAYRQFQRDPFSEGLNFEAVNPAQTIWSARVSSQFRVLGTRRHEEWDKIIWFWIGSHNAYDNLVARYRSRK